MKQNKSNLAMKMNKEQAVKEAEKAAVRRRMEMRHAFVVKTACDITPGLCASSQYFYSINQQPQFNKQALVDDAWDIAEILWERHQAEGKAAEEDLNKAVQLA